VLFRSLEPVEVQVPPLQDTFRVASVEITNAACADGPKTISPVETAQRDAKRRIDFSPFIPAYHAREKG